MLGAVAKQPVDLELATETDLTLALLDAYEGAFEGWGKPVDAGQVAALGQEHGTGSARPESQRGVGVRAYRPVGEILVGQGALTSLQLRAALCEFTKQDGTPLGEFLIEGGYISRDQLDAALAEQEVLSHEDAHAQAAGQS